jgi:protein TonB
MATHLAIVRVDHLLGSIERLSRGKRRFALSWVIATLSHAGVGFALLRSPRPVAERSPPPPRVFELEPVSASPLPEPPANVPPPPEEPARARAPRSAAPEPRAAQAARVLDQAATPEQTVDFTDAVVTGTATVFAGGTTASTGTSTTAIRGPGRARPAAGASNGTGSVPTADPDRSQPARMTGGLDWNCPFPEQANTDGVDRAIATIRVDLDSRGRTKSVAVVRDPGHGFGSAARRCALTKRWVAALDRTGTPVASSVTVAVRFVR